jgi:hypothetical protein
LFLLLSIEKLLFAVGKLIVIASLNKEVVFRLLPQLLTQGSIQAANCKWPKFAWLLGAEL